jgi:O-antigen/teichoic acid export membrane protein
MNGVWGHLHPLVAAHGDGDISRNGLRTTICYAFPIIILLCLSVALSVPFLINYLYTSEFIAAQETILVYFLAEPLYVTISIISAYLIALQKYKACFIMHFSYYVILLLFVYFGSSLLDSLSYALGHLIGTYVIALLYFYSFWKQRLFSSRQILQFFLLILIYDTCLTFDIINSDHTSFNIRLSFICYTLCILFIFKKYFQVLKYRPFIIFKLHE